MTVKTPPRPAIDQFACGEEIPLALPPNHGAKWRYETSLNVSEGLRPEYKLPPESKIFVIARALQAEREGRPIDAAAGETWSLFQQARELHLQPQRRLEAEARILARQTYEEVASELDTDPNVIEYYVCFFFDVVRYLGARARIRIMAIDTAENEKDLIRYRVLHSAYWGGRHVLDFLLGGREALGKPHDLRTKEGRTMERVELTMLVQAAMAGDKSLNTKVLAQWQRISEELPPEEPTLSDVLKKRWDMAFKQGPEDAADDPSTDRLVAWQGDLKMAARSA